MAQEKRRLFIQQLLQYDFEEEDDEDDDNEGHAPSKSDNRGGGRDGGGTHQLATKQSTSADCVELQFKEGMQNDLDILQLNGKETGVDIAAQCRQHLLLAKGPPFQEDEVELQLSLRGRPQNPDNVSSEENDLVQPEVFVQESASHEVQSAVTDHTNNKISPSEHDNSPKHQLFRNTIRKCSPSIDSATESVSGDEVELRLSVGRGSQSRGTAVEVEEDTAEREVTHGVSLQSLPEQEAESVSFSNRKSSRDLQLAAHLSPNETLLSTGSTEPVATAEGSSTNSVSCRDDSTQEAMSTDRTRSVENEEGHIGMCEVPKESISKSTSDSSVEVTAPVQTGMTEIEEGTTVIRAHEAVDTHMGDSISTERWSSRSESVVLFNKGGHCLVGYEVAECEKVNEENVLAQEVPRETGIQSSALDFAETVLRNEKPESSVVKDTSVLDINKDFKELVFWKAGVETRNLDCGLQTESNNCKLPYSGTGFYALERQKLRQNGSNPEETNMELKDTMLGTKSPQAQLDGHLEARMVAVDSETPVGLDPHLETSQEELELGLEIQKKASETKKPDAAHHSFTTSNPVPVAATGQGAERVTDGVYRGMSVTDVEKNYDEVKFSSIATKSYSPGLTEKMVSIIRNEQSFGIDYVCNVLGNLESCTLSGCNGNVGTFEVEQPERSMLSKERRSRSFPNELRFEEEIANSSAIRSEGACFSQAPTSPLDGTPTQAFLMQTGTVIVDGLTLDSQWSLVLRFAINSVPLLGKGGFRSKETALDDGVITATCVNTTRGGMAERKAGAYVPFSSILETAMATSVTTTPVSNPEICQRDAGVLEVDLTEDICDQNPPPADAVTMSTKHSENNFTPTKGSVKVVSAPQMDATKSPSADRESEGSRAQKVVPSMTASINESCPKTFPPESQLACEGSIKKDGKSALQAAQRPHVHTRGPTLRSHFGSSADSDLLPSPLLIERLKYPPMGGVLSPPMPRCKGRPSSSLQKVEMEFAGVSPSLLLAQMMEISSAPSDLETDTSHIKPLASQLGSPNRVSSPAILMPSGLPLTSPTFECPVSLLTADINASNEKYITSTVGPSPGGYVPMEVTRSGSSEPKLRRSKRARESNDAGTMVVVPTDSGEASEPLTADPVLPMASQSTHEFLQVNSLGDAANPSLYGFASTPQSSRTNMQLETDNQLMQAQASAHNAMVAATQALAQSHCLWARLQAQVPQSASQLGAVREAQIASVAASVAAAASVAKAAVEAAKAIAEASNEALAQLGLQNDHVYQNSIEGGVLPDFRFERIGVRDENPQPLQVASASRTIGAASRRKDKKKDHTRNVNGEGRTQSETKRSQAKLSRLKDTSLKRDTCKKGKEVGGTGQEIILPDGGERYQGAGTHTREQIKKGVPFRLKGPNHHPLLKQQFQTIEHRARKGIKETLDIIEEGSTVEVMTKEEGLRGGWFTATVLMTTDTEALVVYDELLTDDGRSQLKEWFPLSCSREQQMCPSLRPDQQRCMRPLHPFSLSRKRRRVATVPQNWVVGDHVDAFIQDGWWEGIVQKLNDDDETRITVHFPGEEDTAVVKSGNLRPTLIWTEGQWRPCKDSLVEDGPPFKRPKIGGTNVKTRKEETKSKKNPTGKSAPDESQFSEPIKPRVTRQSLEARKNEKSTNKSTRQGCSSETSTVMRTPGRELRSGDRSLTKGIAPVRAPSNRNSHAAPKNLAGETVTSSEKVVKKFETVRGSIRLTRMQRKTEIEKQRKSGRLTAIKKCAKSIPSRSDQRQFRMKTIQEKLIRALKMTCPPKARKLTPEEIGGLLPPKKSRLQTSST